MQVYRGEWCRSIYILVHFVQHITDICCEVLCSVLHNSDVQYFISVSTANCSKFTVLWLVVQCSSVYSTLTYWKLETISSVIRPVKSRSNYNYCIMDLAPYTVLYWIKPCRCRACACPGESPWKYLTPVEGSRDILNQHETNSHNQKQAKL